jgi:peptidoglycan/LPS O-acetylase OafA/YrhL
MSTTSKLRLDSIRALRGIAVLLVLLSHLMSIERKYAGDRLLGDWMITGFSGVDLFFGISGFIMVYVTWNSAPGFRQSSSFLLARIGRIYPLYWLVSLALLIVWLKFPQLVFSSESKPPNILHSFALWPSARDPLLPIGWTLIHEMYFYLVFSVVLLLPGKWRLVGIAIWVAVVTAGFYHFFPFKHPPAVPRIIFSTLTLEFVAGVLAGYAWFSWKGKHWQASLALGVAAFLLANLWIIIFLSDGVWTHWVRALLFAPGLLFLIYGMVGLEKSGHGFHRVFTWIGDQSYSLYLTHLLSLTVLGRIWSIFAQPGLIDNIFALFLLFAGSLVVGQITFIVFEKPVLQWSKKLRYQIFG